MPNAGAWFVNTCAKGEGAKVAHDKKVMSTT
jgi:hypothetical protein